MERLNAIIDKLKEPSTVKGLIGLAAVAGLAIDPLQIEKIIAGMIAAQALIQIFVDKK